MEQYTEARRGLTQAVVREVRRMVANAVLSNQRMADQLNLVPTDLQVLNILDINEAVTPGMLSRLTGLTTGGITVALDRLERAGLVKRTRHPADRRSVLIESLEEPIRARAPAYALMEAAVAELLGQYSDEDVKIIADFLAKSNTIGGS